MIIMKNFSIKTNDTCAKQIDFSLEDGKLHNIHFYGGCPGNLEGADARHAVELLKGNKCGSKATSCADQLAQGVEKALKGGN